MVSTTLIILSEEVPKRVGKFKVSYKGFVYVQARDSDHAVEQFDDGEEVYDEREVTLVEEVDEFLVDF